MNAEGQRLGLGGWPRGTWKEGLKSLFENHGRVSSGRDLRGDGGKMRSRRPILQGNGKAILPLPNLRPTPGPSSTRRISRAVFAGRPAFGQTSKLERVRHGNPRAQHRAVRRFSGRIPARRPVRPEEVAVALGRRENSNPIRRVHLPEHRRRAFPSWQGAGQNEAQARNE